MYTTDNNLKICIALRKIEESDYERLWEISGKEDDYLWTHYNAPYFNEYEALSYKDFIIQKRKGLCSEYRLGIYYNDFLIGCLSHYWENQQTRWLEIGIILYDENYWGMGIGKYCIQEYTTMMFEKYPMIERVGFTTWSKNIGMIKIGESLGFTLEKQIRKVRYYEGVYYDSIGYGILREEWASLNKEM